MERSRPFDIDAFLDGSRIRTFHLMALGLLMAAMMVDSYDIFMVGYILPALAQGLGRAPQDLTALFVIQQLGLLLGTLLVGPLSDRYGRRGTMIASLAAAALCTLATTQIRTLGQLEFLRFLAGIFFAAIIPNVVALVSELAPRRLRAGAVSLAFCGYTAGNFLGALVQAWVLPYGWRAPFWVGGVIPLVLVALLWAALPESVRFRVRRDPADPRIATTLRRLDPALELTGSERFETREEPGHAGARSAVGDLLRDGRAGMTLLVWLAFYLFCIFTHLSGSWGTTLLNVTRHVPMTRVALMMSCSAIAGIVGTATGGFIMDRVGAVRAVPSFLGGAAAALAVIGLVDLDSPLVLVAFVALGYCSNGGWGCLNALGATLYPSRIRATGASAAVAAGKLGAMTGPVVGGLMIAAQWDLTPIYLAAALPAIAAALAVVAMRFVAAAPAALPMEGRP